jgi:hypothetical protein
MATTLARNIICKAAVRCGSQGDAIYVLASDQTGDRTAKVEKLEQGVAEFLAYIQTIVLTSQTTVSVTATMRRSAPVSWSQP